MWSRKMWWSCDTIADMCPDETSFYLVFIIVQYETDANYEPILTLFSLYSYSIPAAYSCLRHDILHSLKNLIMCQYSMECYCFAI